MSSLPVLFTFILGAIIGSFLNVVILRYGAGKSVFNPKGRSMCFSCGKKLEWFELVPVASFIFLRAKCRGCKSPLSWQYPLVEIAAGLIFAAIFAKNFPNVFALTPSLFQSAIVLTLIQLAIWSILIVITVYDLRHKIIPDELVYAFVVLSLVAAALFPSSAGGTLLDSLIAGPVFFGFFAGLWLISGGRWLGFGDAKLVLGVGFLLGFARGLSALALAFWIGAVASLILIAASKFAARKVIQRDGLRRRLCGITIKSEIPFAPFIILGALVAFFWSVDVFGFSNFLWI